MGGFSGIDLNADGTTFQMVTDKGHIAKGTLTRRDRDLTGVTITAHQVLRDKNGQERPFPHTDAEGIALGPNGRTYVSFEHFHRVLYYETWDSTALWPSYTMAWRALSQNQGLEALAVSEDGTLYTLPEYINTGATQALVYRKYEQGRWQQPFTLPVDSEFSPVGADFGPDGRFYVLERGVYPFGFFSRVRAMTVSDAGFDTIETVFHSRLARHGNLEGLAVWQDQTGAIRLTMVSDNNFYPFMRSQIVEYVLQDGLATAPQ